MQFQMMIKRKRPITEIQQCPAKCIACGGAASGYHYDAPSCSSCKTFFRRAVLSGKVYDPCYNDGQCDKDESIRPCRTCRFERCVDGGMNPLLIHTLKNPDENPVVQKVLRIKYDKGNHSSSTVDIYSPPSILPKRVIINPSVIECKIDRIIGSLLYLEKSQHELRSSSKFNPSLADGYRLDTVIAGHSRLNSNFLDQHCPTFEKNMEIINLLLPSTPNARKFWPFVDMFLSIEYMKTFEFFHCLSHDDKKALVRHVAVMCSHLTLAFFSYENKSDTTYHPDGTMPYNGGIDKNDNHQKQLHHGVIETLRLLELDKKEYVLLKALIVCNPVIEALSGSYKEQLENERLKYSKSLLSYVMWRRGHDKGPAAYTAIINVVDTLTHLMKRHKNWFVLMQALQYKRGSILNSSLLTDVYLH